MFGNGKRDKRIAELESALTENRRAYDDMQAWYSQYGGKEAWVEGQALSQIQEERSQAEAQLRELRAQVDEFKGELEYLHANEYDYKKLNELREESDTLASTNRELQACIEISRAGLGDEQGNPAEDSISLKADLADVRQSVKKMVSEKKAVKSRIAVSGDMKAAERKQLANAMVSLALRAFNAETNGVIRSATVANYDASCDKILRSAAAIEKLGKAANIQFYKTYLKSRLVELKLAVDHLTAKKLEQELAREHKAALREQAKLERELQAERERLEKEKQHYINILKTVESLGDQDEVSKIKSQIADIERGIADVDYRQANIRAGYVYVISNIGAFGPDMVKIGMTRRLEPLDRVKELSSASVPFNFDVHAMFFSEDAVTVENELHHRFADKRVNKVNTRREFFRVSPSEVRDVLLEIQGNLLEFVEVPEAEQYWLSVQETQDRTSGGIMPSSS